MEYNQYDLSELEYDDLSIDELEDDLMTEIITKDNKSRNVLDLIYAAIGLME